ncbi:F-box only protein 15 isoform X1 [Pangasianodon hypophthalmus]|uniref:F-box only protein 15 isoform X1 n=2 Tax=Pangasianodon hypophthalmus TaxID=310915 RepID=UPI002306E020|nr:F-box only protein 15 isoform X1 [Pangasianodon hypophthalmus]
MNSQRLKRIMVHRSSTCPKPPPRSVRSSENYIERMPPEVTEKIISYLDAGSLFCLGFVNKRFHELVDNNAMWYRFYTWQRAKTKTSRLIKDVTDGVDMASIQEKPMGYWRRVFFKELAGHNGSWKKKLKSIHSYTGLPIRTAEVLRSFGVMWEITVKEARGRENRIKHTHVYFGQASLTVGWSSGNWPILDKPTTLELHGVMLVPINCPITCRPGWRSLLSKVVVKKDGSKLCGSDRLISLLYIEKDVTVGVWQKQQEIAFVLVNLHYHRLVERNLLGSSTTLYEPTDMQAPFDDIDPDYGLHRYCVHLELHNTVESIASVSFSQLFCKKDQIADGYLPLQVISKENRSRQTPLCGKISLPWRTEALQGHIEHCCMLTLTVLAEAQTPFWCVSAPVAITKSNHEEVSYDCNGESFFMEYQDSDGKLEIELEWMEEQKQFVMVNLILFLSVSKVNRHFRRHY